MTGMIQENTAAETVRYTPGDCALLMGHSEVLLRHLGVVHLIGLRPALLCTDLPDLDRLPHGLRALGGRMASVRGWMGAFNATLHTAQGEVDIAPLSFHADGHFDWVLDFSGFKPTEVLPPGWNTLADGDRAGLKHAMLEIARCMREGYEKPHYCRLDKNLCAHARQGISGCHACLDVCPVGAITPGRVSVRIESCLCQGCGACALACPAGAVRHVIPGTGETLRRLAVLLTDGGKTSGLWVVPEGKGADAPVGWRPFTVVKSASLGAEFWLAALAMGCRRVAIATEGLSPRPRAALAQQSAWVQALLTGLGHPPVLGLADSADELADLASMPDLPSFDLPDVDDKRVILLAAVAALSTPSQAPVEIGLPNGYFGTVVITEDKCILCAVCVRLCPTGALHLPGSASQLAFREDRCVQCGLCINGCPEHAMALQPRLLVSPAARQTPRVVAQAVMFACTGCGQPFATRAMVERSRDLMAGHPMFQGENARLMTLCPDCRQRAMAG